MNKAKIIQYLEISLGVLLLSIAYYFFFLPADLVIGGVSGIVIIIEAFLPFLPSIFIFIVNSILLIVGLFLLGKNFFMKTFYATLLFPSIIFIFEKVFDPYFLMKNVTEGKYFIACLCGSALIGTGLGISFRNNGTTGGIDVIQKILAKYLHVPYSKTLYLTDWVIVIIGGIIFKPFGYDIEKVTFGIIGVYLTGYIIDYIALNAKVRRTAYIITDNPEAVKKMIYEKINRGVTQCAVRGGYSNEEKVMLICTLNKSESYRLQEYVHIADEKAFTFLTTTKEVLGNYDK